MKKTKAEREKRFMEIQKFFAVQSEAESMGEEWFTCPICGGKAWWGRSPVNGHLHAGCDGCGLVLIE